MLFEACLGCGHRAHDGIRCLYPKHLFSTPGRAPERCGCRKENARRRFSRRTMKRQWKDGRHFRQRRTLERLAKALGADAVRSERGVALIRSPLRVRCGACGWVGTWIGGARSGRACHACGSLQVSDKKRLRELRDLAGGDRVQAIREDHVH